MMRDFVAATLEAFDDCTEDMRECLRKIIVRGFAPVKVTPSFRAVIAEAFGVDFQTVETMKQNDLVRMGLLVMQEPEVVKAYQNHAELVDQFWGLLINAEALR
jgi:hypothetical protein